jgi:hypothetical protein
MVHITQHDWFNLANQTIKKAEEEGRTRDALIMKSKLKTAQECWEEEDYTRAKMMLEQIIPIPEPLAILIFITLLFLMPAGFAANLKTRYS